MDPEWPSPWGRWPGPLGLPVGGPALVRGKLVDSRTQGGGAHEALRMWGQSPCQGTKALQWQEREPWLGEACR